MSAYMRNTARRAVRRGRHRSVAAWIISPLCPLSRRRQRSLNSYHPGCTGALLAQSDSGRVALKRVLGMPLVVHLNDNRAQVRRPVYSPRKRPRFGGMLSVCGKVRKERRRLPEYLGNISFRRRRLLTFIVVGDRLLSGETAALLGSHLWTCCEEETRTYI
ncbi:hypothetical protein BV25DRAFT_777045 [Artomyces pyxidatus]|uniref:Uncharacterized protein n=1 Tax=Artomyces pyxidatus TaxID=48021 RepID=A0ACB8SYT3_9AGAM|nr:hypothetical protein BV25DRAFT_777045 [Artomyces pyxidatus]